MLLSSIAFPVLPSCVLPRVFSKTLRACDRLHLRLHLFIRKGGAYIMLIPFSSLVPRYRIERFFDPTPHIYASQINPNSHVLHIPANLCLAMYLACLTTAQYA